MKLLTLVIALVVVASTAAAQERRPLYPDNPYATVPPSSGERTSPYTPVNPRRDTTYKNGDLYCQPYEMKVFVNGKIEVAHGLACKDALGHWLVATQE